MLYDISAKDAGIQMYKEGLYFLYRGMLPPLCQKTASLSLMFGIYDASRTYFQLRNVEPYMNKTLSGIISGTTEAALAPFERVQTLLVHSKYHDEFKNMQHALRNLRFYGLKEYYRGFLPILYRNGPSNACFFIMRDEILMKCEMKLPNCDTVFRKSVLYFLVGAVTGATVSSVFYPLNVVKMRMQRRLGGDFDSIIEVLKRIYIERGSRVLNIYRGLGTNCIRAFFSWGVVTASHENFRALFY